MTNLKAYGIGLFLGFLAGFACFTDMAEVQALFQ
jgi:hypothetical protein